MHHEMEPDWWLDRRFTMLVPLFLFIYQYNILWASIQNKALSFQLQTSCLPMLYDGRS